MKPVSLASEFGPNGNCHDGCRTPYLELYCEYREKGGDFDRRTMANCYWDSGAHRRDYWDPGRSSRDQAPSRQSAAAYRQGIGIDPVGTRYERGSYQMSDRQDQKVGAGATAIQSARDTNINEGISPGQMQQIIETVAAQVPVYAAIAREIVDGRLKDFEDRVLSRFDKDTSAKSEAFKDPDFQYLLGQAQHAFARSGEDKAGDLLVDLIAERSKCTDRDRLALTLNQSVETAATLTVNEYAELAFCYIFSQTRALDATDLPAFYRVLNDRINPYVDDIAKTKSSYSYLEAQRCANVGMMMTNFRDLLVNSYTAFFMPGIEPEDVKAAFPAIDVKNSSLFITALRDTEKIQPKALVKEVWDHIADENMIGEVDRDGVWRLFLDSTMAQEVIISSLEPHVPRIKDAFSAWDSTSVNSLQLTTVGLAIGHAYASTHGLKASLSTWID